MGKGKDNLCRQALIEGQQSCNKKDLLTECIETCKNIGVTCISEGKPLEAVGVRM